MIRRVSIIVIMINVENSIKISFFIENSKIGDFFKKDPVAGSSNAKLPMKKVEVPNRGGNFLGTSSAGPSKVSLNVLLR